MILVLSIVSFTNSMYTAFKIGYADKSLFVFVHRLINAILGWGGGGGVFVRICSHIKPGCHR